MRKVVLVIIIVLLILSGAAAGALYMIGDRLLDSMIVSEDTTAAKKIQAAENPEAALRTVPGDKGGQLHTAESIATDSGDADKLKGALPALDKQEGTQSKTKITDKAAAASQDIAQQPPSKENEALPSPPVEAAKSNAGITATELKQLEEKVTAADKVNAAAIVLKKLKPAEINELKGMLAGGVTEAEKEKAKQIVYKSFTQKEITEIKEIYHKYLQK